MRPSLVRNLLAAVMIIALGIVAQGRVEDYLVIKKEGGSDQKIPLDFPPEQIESFQVESAAPTTGTPSIRERRPAQADEESAPSAREPEETSVDKAPPRRSCSDSSRRPFVATNDF